MKCHYDFLYNALEMEFKGEQLYKLNISVHSHFVRLKYSVIHINSKKEQNMREG